VLTRNAPLQKPKGKRDGKKRLKGNGFKDLMGQSLKTRGRKI
jgi:hypothetical protein